VSTLFQNNSQGIDMSKGMIIAGKPTDSKVQLPKPFLLQLWDHKDVQVTKLIGIGMPWLPVARVNKNKVVKHGNHLSLTDAYNGVYLQTGIKCTQGKSTYVPSVKFSQRLRCHKDLNVYD
jgi:hypothetical protein